MAAPTEIHAPKRRLWAALRGGRPPIVASVVLVLFLLASVAPGLLDSTDPNATSLSDALQPPSWFGEHPLGTDALGRDMLARIVHGAGYSFIVAMAAIALSGLIGVAAGVASGFAPRGVAAVVMRLADAALGVPLFLVALTLAVARGPGMLNVVVVIGGLLWAQYARVISADVAKVGQLAFVDAARVLGTSVWRIVPRHVLPNVFPTVLTLLASQIGAVILLEASLSFLGAGVPPPAPAWGALVASGRDLIGTAWWVSAFPGVAILAVVIAFNSIADWLRRAVDPVATTNSVTVAPVIDRTPPDPDGRRGGDPGAAAAPADGSAALPSPAPSAPAALLEVAGLRVGLVGTGPERDLVQGVSFEIGRGEFVGLIGESGSGKTLTASALVRLLPDQFRVGADALRVAGREVLTMSPRELQRVRGGRIGFVFQDHTQSLDPTATVGSHIAEVLTTHQGMNRRQARARVLELLELVGIPDPARRAGAYPHQFSGGMGQRVALAAALAGEPELLIADEPTTALDATVQAKILELLADLCRRSGMSMLIITHDLGVARQVCDRILVMYGGRIVESGRTEDILRAPASPYTRALLAALPDMGADRDRPLGSIEGTPPTPGTLTAGCRFAPRCGLAHDVCHTDEPALTARPGAGHRARCWATEPEGWDVR